MTVDVRPFATLRRHLPGGETALRIRLGDGATVRDAVRRAGIPEESPRIVMVNGRLATLDAALADGDAVSLFPAVGGG
ncbi:MAG: MoaD/ThiS family protein [bacterium]|nr:MoaD/ThiS family protein [bacterium]